MDFWHSMALGGGAALSYTFCRWLFSATSETARIYWLSIYRTRKGVPRQAQLDLMAAQFGDARALKPSSLWTFTPDWTAQERVMLCILFTHIFRDDFTAGRYGLPGRPNVQTLHELLQLSSVELETHRKDIEAVAFAYENHLDVAEVLKTVQ